MNKKSFAIFIAILALVGVAFGLRLLTSKHAEQSEAEIDIKKMSVVDVDKVASDPEKYVGLIGIEGSVISVDGEKSTFGLGCEDACVLVPVAYRGALPKEGTNVIAYGEVQKTNGDKYIFVAKEIAVK
jgi:cytochrome c-type biogenesis protein CcmE